jgi:hypothetical protein
MRHFSTDRSNTVAIGDSALYHNGVGAAQSWGSFNTAVGSKSLWQNTTGYSNTGTGLYTLFSNTIGAFNSAFGSQSLANCTTGSYNTGLGSSTLPNNSTWSIQHRYWLWRFLLQPDRFKQYGNRKSVAVQKCSGNSNVAVGTNALYSSSDKSNLVAIGDSALYNNGTGTTAPSRQLKTPVLVQKQCTPTPKEAIIPR